MRKIPTIFKRDPENMKYVLPEVVPGCEWVLAGEGRALRKYDGTCCMFDGATWWARRELKLHSELPPDFTPVHTDGATGKTVGWVPMEGSSFDKWHGEAYKRARMDGGLFTAGTYELCGPKINGNPEGYTNHVLIYHAGAEHLTSPPRDFEGLREWLASSDFEGIVWHHSDGRMAKLKKRDFPKSQVVS